MLIEKDKETVQEFADNLTFISDRASKIHNEMSEKVEDLQI